MRWPIGRPGAKPSQGPTGRDHAAEPGALRVAVPVFGLGLGGCGVEQLERALRAEPGVIEVYVNPATETAYVTYDPAQSQPGGLRRALEGAGLRAGAPETWRWFR